MNGIEKRKIDDTTIIKIQSLSEELKDTIKKNLVEICYGEYAFSSNSEYYSFSKTLGELVNHRIPSSRNKRIGAIGEILLNVIIREFTDLKIISPFFNLEERNVKKGFDIIAVDSKKDLWIIESKAGEQKKNKSLTAKICERIKKADNDLEKRLNSENSQLWTNAINSVRVYLNESDQKKVILNILGKKSNTSISEDKNVVLGGTVFCVFDSVIDESKLKKLYKKINNTKKFSKVRLIVIQKKTFEAVIDYLLTLI